MNTTRHKSSVKIPSDPLDMEKSLAALEAIVEQLESGDLPLDKSLLEFERGVRLSRECQGALKAAEQHVQVLMGNTLEDFAPNPRGDKLPDEEDPAD